jgi:transcriptional regulator with XRE-family HTH domain
VGVERDHDRANQERARGLAPVQSSDNFGWFQMFQSFQGWCRFNVQGSTRRRSNRFTPTLPRFENARNVEVTPLVRGASRESNGFANAYFSIAIPQLFNSVVPVTGKNIKTIRLVLHMSQERFGRAAGNYSQDTVAKWEQTQFPPALILKRIAEISDPPRSVDWILDSGQSQQAVGIGANFGQIIFDALRPLIGAEIDAYLKRIGPTAAKKEGFAPAYASEKNLRQGHDLISNSAYRGSASFWSRCLWIVFSEGLPSCATIYSFKYFYRKNQLPAHP